MHRTRLSVLVLLGLLGTPWRAAADLTGVWDFVFRADLGELTNCALNIQQTGTSVSIAPAVPSSYCPTVNGTVVGSALATTGTCFTSTLFTMSGTVGGTGDDIAGTFSCGGFGTTFTATRALCAPTTCDDGNPCTTDDCTGAGVCTHTPNTGPCDDGNACTSGDHCVGGSCLAGTAVTCDACRFCLPPGGCTALANPVCRHPTGSNAATVTMTDRTPDTQDRFGWKWTSGGATTKFEFGSPLTTTTYDICVFDQTTLRFGARAPAGCSGGACWTETTNGFTYTDRGASGDGLTRIQLRAGGSGQARITAKGKGLNLDVPELPLPGSVRIQVMNRDSFQCWEALHDNVTVGTATRYRATGD